MFRRTLIIIGLIAITLSAYAVAHEQTPKSIVEGEVACGDSAEADRIVISKETMSLKLYDKENQLICAFPISLGRDYGDKQKLGDFKTPEGDFSIAQIQRSSHWMYNSGKESIKGYYGNWFIRLNTRYSSIGIHGTHDPEHIGKRTTEGSIRLNNSHRDSLRTMVNVGMAVRIESSRLDLDSDGKSVAEAEIPTISAENAHPIINGNATAANEQMQEETATDRDKTTDEEVDAEAANSDAKKRGVKEEWYTVKYGDLVGRIAVEYGISVAELKRLNPELNVDRISIGQKIKVKGEGVETPAEEQQTTPVEQSNANDAWHTVVDGDRVGRIAVQYGISVAELKRLNPELNVDRISIGQKIKVKGEAAAESERPQPTTTIMEEGNANEVWHTVADGDLVGRIAAQYGTTTRRIQELNPELNVDRISIGQRIRVK